MASATDSQSRGLISISQYRPLAGSYLNSTIATPCQESSSSSAFAAASSAGGAMTDLR